MISSALLADQITAAGSGDPTWTIGLILTRLFS